VLILDLVRRRCTHAESGRSSRPTVCYIRKVGRRWLPVWFALRRPMQVRRPVGRCLAPRASIWGPLSPISRYTHLPGRWVSTY